MGTEDDSGPGDDDEAIKAVLGDGANAIAFEVLKEDAEKLIEKLKQFSDQQQQ